MLDWIKDVYDFLGKLYFYGYHAIITFGLIWLAVDDRKRKKQEEENRNSVTIFCFHEAKDIPSYSSDEEWAEAYETEPDKAASYMYWKCTQIPVWIP